MKACTRKDSRSLNGKEGSQGTFGWIHIHPKEVLLDFLLVSFPQTHISRAEDVADHSVQLLLGGSICLTR